MAQHKKKAKQRKKEAKQPTCTEKQVANSSSPVPWPNLPHQLVDIIARKRSLMQNITSLGGITKSWRATPRHCPRTDKSPWAQLVEINSNKHDHSHKNTRVLAFSLHPEYSYWYHRRKKSYRWRWQYLKGYSHGKLVAATYYFTEFYLWEPARKLKSLLPPWDHNIPFRLATLSSKLPEDRDNRACNIMVLTGSSAPAFAFHRWGKDRQREWIVQDCTLPDPYGSSSSEYMNFTNAIGFQDKFYALSLQGSLAVIEDVDSCFKITAIGANRAVSSKVSRQFREYLMESNGEILLVFFISRKSVNVVDDVEVFRLDIPKLLWVKVESLGDTALFLEDECCMAVTANRVGCKKNCIYFSHSRISNWLVFDMETCCILPMCGSNGDSTESLTWDETLEPEQANDLSTETVL